MVNVGHTIAVKIVGESAVLKTQLAQASKSLNAFKNNVNKVYGELGKLGKGGVFHKLKDQLAEMGEPAPKELIKYFLGGGDMAGFEKQAKLIESSITDLADTFQVQQERMGQMKLAKKGRFLPGATQVKQFKKEFLSDIESIVSSRSKIDEVSKTLKKLGVSVPVEQIAKMKRGMKLSEKDINKYSDAVKEAVNKLENYKKSSKGVKEALDKQNKSATSTGRSMYYMGITTMFLGMTIKRIFKSILKSTTNTFTRIMESSGQLGTAVQRLGVHWEYLKFTIGSALNRALEPLMPIITKIINSLAGWINKHPKLTAAILAFGFVLGSLLAIGGMVALNLKLLSTITEGLGPIFASQEDDVEDLGDVFASQKDDAKGLGKVLTWLQGINWGLLASAVALAAGFLLVGAVAWKLKEKLGSWGEFFKSVLRGLIRVAAIVTDAIVSAIRWMINKIIDGVNWMIDEINKLLAKEWVQKGLSKLGIELKEIDPINKLHGQYGDLAWKIEDKMAEGWLAPEKGYLSSEELADVANPLTLIEDFKKKYMEGEGETPGKRDTTSGTWSERDRTNYRDARGKEDLKKEGGTTVNVNNMRVEANNWEEFVDEVKSRQGLSKNYGTGI